MFAFAEPGSTEVETQRWKPERMHCLGCAIDHFVVHGAAALGVRVTHECSVPRLRLSFDEKRFKISRRTRDGECLQAVGDAGHRIDCSDHVIPMTTGRVERSGMLT